MRARSSDGLRDLAMGAALMSAAAAVSDIDDKRVSPAQGYRVMLPPGTRLSKVQPRQNARASTQTLRHSGMVRQHQTRNLEIPGSMLRIAPE